MGLVRTTLRPVIGVGRLFRLTVAVIAPAASFLLTYGAAYQSAGTGLVIGFLIGAVLNVLVMFGYAEAGRVHPESGGDYSLTSKALGPRVGSVYTSLFTWKGLVIPAILSLATASYIAAAWPGIPLSVAAVLVLLIYLTLAEATCPLRASSPRRWCWWRPSCSSASWSWRERA